MNQILLCPWESPFLLIFSSNVPKLLYYSHLPVMLAAFILAVFIYTKSKTLASNVLAVILGLFSFYALIDVLIWATNRSDIVYFLWSIQVMVEVLIFAAALYVLYLVGSKRDAPMPYKILFGAILIPFILLIPTHYNLIGIDLSTCNAVEGFVALYLSYILEIFFGIIIVLYSVHKFFTLKASEEKKKIALLAIGILLFLVALISGNIVGSFTENWNLAQFGFFGMPVLIGLITYLIVEFKMFDLKLLGAQAFVLSLWALIVSLFFIRDIANIRLITGITLMLSVGFGVLLIRSVKREVTLREQLQLANEGQSNLMHIINHQIKGYLAKSRNIFAELLVDPTYNACTDEAKPMLNEGFKSLTEGVDFVKDFLDAANIEQGTYTYKMEPFDFKSLVAGVVDKQKEAAKEKGLTYESNISDGDFKVNGDKVQLEQAVRNLIDNSIHYTPTGSIKVNLTKKDNKILFTVKDTGVGISDELRPRLFTKGGRGRDSQKININSTGFGLAFVKNVADAHKGRVSADSPGPNLGSTFSLELPSK